MQKGKKKISKGIYCKHETLRRSTGYVLGHGRDSFVNRVGPVWVLVQTSSEGGRESEW